MADPGVGSGEIVIGGTIPLSGIAASYGSVGRGAEAYFKYINARGGVNGRRITYKYMDDQYNPAQTVQVTRQLVQQERVFAIFNSLGTEHNLAIRAYLNAAKVPQLFVGSGATTFGRDHRRYPYTIGFLPSYVGEAKVYARHIRATKPNAKIAVLYQNDDYGKDLLIGLSASPRIIDGAITLQAYKDPTNPKFRRDAGIRLYRQIMAQHLPRGDANDAFHVYSMAVAHTFVDALRRAGRNPTRASIVRAAASLNVRNNPFMLPGISIRTTSTDHFPIEQGQLYRWRNNQWNSFGKVL